MKQSTHRTIKFSILVRIENFPSFVISKAKYKSVFINFNYTEWFIKIRLYKYCQTSKQNIHVTSSSSEQPETLGAFLCGKRSDQKKCSFVVEATFKLRKIPRAMEWRYSQKFCFTSTKSCDIWGYRDFTKIDVILLYLFLLVLLTTNFRIFWTRAMAIWLITHLKCSSMYHFLSVNKFCSLSLSIADEFLNWSF